MLATTEEEKESAMKIHARHLMMLAVIATSLTGMSFAQQFTYRVVANVPYDFYVGDQLYSAGDYLFAVNYGDRAVTITTQANGHSSVVKASPVEYASPGYDRRDKGTVVELASVGDHYVLSDLQMRTNGVSFPMGANTRAVAKKEGVVTLVASLR
jgi:hypothetical protein